MTEQCRRIQAYLADYLEQNLEPSERAEVSALPFARCAAKSISVWSRFRWYPHQSLCRMVPRFSRQIGAPTDSPAVYSAGSPSGRRARAIRR